MLTLREALIRTIEKNNLATYLFPAGQVAQITNELQKKYNTVGSLSAPDNLEMIRKLFLLVERTDSWEKVNLRAWKKACWVLWSGDESLATSKRFLAKYIEFCNAHISVRVIKTLIHVFLRDYKDDLPGLFEITKLIRTQLNVPSFKNRLMLWKERDENYNLFAIKANFSVNADNYLRGNKQADEFLTACGLEGILETANYAQGLFEAIIKEVENKITTTSMPMSLFNKLINFAVSEEKKLRYPSKKNVLIESILRPWKNKIPPTELCKKILEFLLANFSDPRTNEGRRTWIGISDDSQRTIKKWLAGATLEQFFEIIDNTAEDRHWRYRRAFWNAYYELGYIDDAWIALGRDSRTEVRSQASMGNELIAADLRGSGFKSDHSVLIFKVGELTICEWSHVGKCRVWLSNNKNAPHLYDQTYLAKQLLYADENFSISHQQSSKYGWQYKLAEYIEYHTGIKIPRYKYEIK